MPDKNPYASHLAGREPMEVMGQTPLKLERLYQKLGGDGMNRSVAPGKWTAREILAHLADCEIAFSFRIRQTLAQDRHEVQPFDQNLWARNYAAYQEQQALAAMIALRRWNMELLSSLSPEMLKKPLHHPERGDMVLGDFVSLIAGHDLNHLSQLETIAGQGASAK